jgi:transcriptional regulator with GAF, ATPase, and Fis domain
MQEPTALAEGALLAGRYRVVRELGRGGSGRVLLAHDLAARDAGGEPAERALKLVGREREAELRLELDVLRGLRHPCLAVVHELVTVDRRAGLSALVSEVAPGRAAHTVARELQARTRSRALAGELPALALRVAHDVGSALAALHARGLIHGDVKPDNIVVRDDLGACKLVDLGLAAPARCREATSRAQLGGTLAYLAPECFRGERSAASDLYALGVTLAALLRGAPESASAPSHASHDIARHLREALRPFSEREALPEATPPALAKLVAELIEPRAAQRSASARGLVARVLSIAHTLAIDLGASVGGGVDDVASAAERAASIQALPLVGQSEPLAQLRAALSEGRVCALIGPAGCGRSRLAREAVAALQLERLARGALAPSYLVAPRLPEAKLGAPSCVHVTHGEQVSLANALAFAESARVDGTFAGLVLEREAAFGAGPQDDVVEIRVAALREGEVRKLLEHALPGTAVPNALVQSALAVSGGLAGRLCRMLSYALAEGVAVERPGAFRAAVSTLAFDATAAGDDSLWPEAGRELAELLSVAGGEAELAWLATGAAVEHAARALRELGVVALVGDRLVLRGDVSRALLATLSAAHRQRLAAQLEAAPLDARARAFVSWARGEGRAEAAFEQAVESARAEGEPERAASLAGEARALLIEAQPGTLRGLGLAEADALRASGRYAEAAACLDGDPALLAAPRGALLRAEIARLAGASDRAELSARARALALQHHDDGVLSELDALDARLGFDRGELAEAAALAQATLARSPCTAAAELRAREILALIALAEGDHGAANARVQSALASARAAQLPAAEARLMSIHAQVARALGDGAVAQRFARAVELADAAGERHAGASFLHNLGIERLEQGQLGAAALVLREAARRLARLGREADLARALLNVGLCAQLSGAVGNALDAALRACELAQRAGDAVTLAHAVCLRAELQLERGERRAALASLDALPARDGLPLLTAGSVAARGAAMHAQLGDLERAAQLLLEAEQAAAQDEQPALALEVALAQCRLAREHGRAAGALQAAERARAAALRAGSFDARLRAALATASAARSLGDNALAVARLSEARSLLDDAATTLPPESRAAFRALPAYGAALEAAPSRESGGAQPLRSDAAQPGAAEHDPRVPRLLALAKRFAGERRAGRLHDLVLDAAVELTGAERGYLVLQDRSGQPRARAVRGLVHGADFVAPLPNAALDQLAHSRSIVARVLATGRALSTVDAARDERLSSAASVHQLALRSVLAVPLRLQGELRGALYLEDRQRPFAFGDAEAALLTDLAELAGHALDNLALAAAERRARMRLEIARARLARTVQAQAAELSSLRTPDHGPAAHGMIACSPRMQRVVALGLKVAGSDLPVLLRGESGTGKELMARAIHRASPRRGAPFISENCGAIPEPLLESTLFGHVKGAFTGADRRRHGLFELADGGTLLLDEIGEMPAAMQVRLLRVLQDGEVRPVGSERSRHVDVRVVAATHRDLEAMVRARTFREDLYYRLSVVTVDLPPLRERPEDLAPLVEALIAKHAGERAVRIDPSTLEALTRCRFPGNVRQLENEMRRALALCGDTIGLEHLSPSLFGGEQAPVDPLDMRAQVDALERRLIRRALEESAGNQTRAARLLGVSRFGLQKMMRRLGSVDLAS